MLVHLKSSLIIWIGIDHANMRFGKRLMLKNAISFLYSNCLSIRYLGVPTVVYCYLITVMYLKINTILINQLK